MPVISDINPNSLGALQPIRAPQVPISIPNPLSVAPFFQGQQLQQNERRLDQQDIAMALQEKQMEFAQSELLFRQTKEILDMGDMSVENAYNEHTSRQSSQSGGSGYGSQLGLNMAYKGHQKVAAEANAQIGDFHEKTLNAARAALNGGDPKALNALRIDTAAGLFKNKQALQNNPEYIKYAVQEQKFNRFLKGTAAEIAKGNSVDNEQFRRTEQLYKKFADGEHLTLREGQELEQMLSDSNIQAMSFNQTKGKEWLKATIEAASAPILKEQGIDDKDPRAPGYGIVKSTETYLDPAEVLHQTVQAAATNVDLVKMFKAATGLDIRDKKNYGAFANWIAVQAKPYIHPGGQFTTDVGAVIVDPTKVLAAKAKSGTSAAADSGIDFGSGVEGEKAESIYNGIVGQNKEITGPLGMQQAVYDIANTAAEDREYVTDEKTGITSVYKVSRDKDGNPIQIAEEKDGKTTYTPLRTLIATISPRKTSAAIPSGGVQYPQGTIQNGSSTLVPRFDRESTLPSYVNAGINAYESGRTDVMNALSESSLNLQPGQNPSLARNKDGDIGTYQFSPKGHKGAFLKFLAEKKGWDKVEQDWDTAYSKVGNASEFAGLETEYYEDKIAKPSTARFVKAIEDSGLKITGIEDPKAYNVVLDFVRSSGNQTGDAGNEKIIKRTIDRLKTYDNPDLYTVAKEFYQERAKYIMNEAPPTEGFKNEWWKIGVNRPYQEYVLVRTMLDRIKGINLNEDGTPVDNSFFETRLSGPVDGVAAPTSTATEVSTATPQEIQTQVAVEDANLHPAIKRVQEVYLGGQKPSPAKMMEFINEAGLITPDRETTSPSRLAKLAGVTTSGPSEITRANEALQRAENDLQVIENKIKEDSKVSQRRGDGPIAKEQDPRYIKAANAVDAALGKRDDLANLFADEADAILKAEAFPSEAKESYKAAAELLQSVIGSTLKYDLDGLNPDLDGTIIEYEDDPGVFSIQEKGKKERDITLKELAEWIEDNAKVFAFGQFDPVQLRRDKIKQASVQQPTTSAVPTPAAAPLSSQDKVNKLRGIKQ